MTANRAPDLREITAAFGRIGLLSFGGPAGQIALMHAEIVEKRGWVDEDAYLRALNLCHLLPGPEAQQLATWIGWRLAGLRGGLVAGTLFVIPGALVILALSILYGFAARLAWFDAVLLGVKAAVLAIVVQALLRVAGRALDTGFKRALAGVAFVALFLFDLPFPLVVIGSGIVGAVVPAVWLKLKPVRGGDRPRRIAPSAGRTLRTIAIGLALWLLPLAVVAGVLGPDHVLTRIGVFFAQLAVVTFGGAYAVLAYMAQHAVETYGWLNAGEMADGLGLAETTPGPLIMVTQFVGYLAAFRAAAPFTPLVAGVIGALLTTWVTFVPCFLWIFALAPWMDRLERAPRLQGALAAVTAAVVGVIANLSAWFALHVLFARVEEVRAGPLRLFVLKRSVLTTLAICAAAGAALGLAFS